MLQWKVIDLLTDLATDMGVRQQFNDDIDSILKRDPAARSRLEVVLCYPGFHAVASHRLAACALSA